MRILWVRREPILAEGGDAIVDMKFVKELSRLHEVTVYAVKRDEPPRKISKALFRGVPPDRAPFCGHGDVDRICDLAAQGFQSILFSHEQLDVLARAVGRRLGPQRPRISLLLHNVPSDMLPQIASNRFVGIAAGTLWRAFERRSFASPDIDDIFTIAKRDARLVKALSGRRDVPVFHPGAPERRALNPDARFRPDLVVSGTFDWFPKGRNMMQFAHDYARWTRDPKPDVYLSPNVSADLLARLSARTTTELDFASAIRIGLVTDRFVAGHKLKVAEYLSANLIPISFSEIAEDFAFSAAASRLICFVRTMDELSREIDRFAAMPPQELHALVAQAKDEVLTELSWARQAGKLSDYLEASARSGKASRDPSPPTVGEPLSLRYR